MCNFKVGKELCLSAFRPKHGFPAAHILAQIGGVLVRYLKRLEIPRTPLSSLNVKDVRVLVAAKRTPSGAIKMRCPSKLPEQVLTHTQR